jgi:hypothetical protein
VQKLQTCFLVCAYVGLHLHLEDVEELGVVDVEDRDVDLEDLGVDLEVDLEELGVVGYLAYLNSFRDNKQL